MIQVIEKNGNQLASAKDLHAKLGMTQQFSQWFKYNKKRAMLNDVDFITILTKSTGDRTNTYYLLKNKSDGFICIFN